MASSYLPRRRPRVVQLCALVAALIACDPSPDPPGADATGTLAPAHALTATSATTAPSAPKVPATLPPGAVLEILGVAQDAGVPQAACDSPNCRAARADPERVRYATSLALVSPSGSTYLFEATPDLRPQLSRLIELARLRQRPDRGRTLLDGIFVTHAHMGHYAGLVHLGFEAAHSQDVPLYASAKMISFLGSNQPWRQLFELKNLVAHPLTPGEASSLGEELAVTPIVVPHRDELSDTLAWRVEGPRQTLLFMPDCDPWSRWASRGFSLEPMLEGVDTFIVDATFYSGDELPGRALDKIGHPLVTDTLELLGPRVKDQQLRVVLIHFNHSNPLNDPAAPQADAVRAAGFEVARRGQQFEL